MKQIIFSFYPVINICLFLGFLLSVFLALHYPLIDYQLFRLIRNHPSQILTVITSYSIDPKYWIPYYNMLLILLYVAFGNRFSKVVLGVLILFFIVYFLSDWSSALGLADKAYFSPRDLNADDITRLSNSGRFSYHHIAMVFAMAAYLSIVLSNINMYKWLRLLVFACALLIAISCIYSGTLLPFSALNACFAGIIPACLITPMYSQKIIDNQLVI